MQGEPVLNYERPSDKRSDKSGYVLLALGIYFLLPAVIVVIVLWPLIGFVISEG
jgi:hypothetical protein